MYLVILAQMPRYPDLFIYITSFLVKLIRRLDVFQDITEHHTVLGNEA